MKKARFDHDEATLGTPYPPPHDEPCKGRKSWSLTRGFGLTQFGVNRVEIPPGGWSTQRHWHRTNDELVVVISGELVLVTDDGEEALGPGDSVAFPMNEPNAHHLQNRGNTPAVFYDIGGRDMYDVSIFPDAGFKIRPRFEFRIEPIKP